VADRRLYLSETSAPAAISAGKKMKEFSIASSAIKTVMIARTMGAPAGRQHLAIGARQSVTMAGANSAPNAHAKPINPN
jgi:hypothetical protein